MLTVSGHTFLLGVLGSQQDGVYVLVDSLPHESLTGRADSGFILRCNTLRALVKVLLASISSRPSAKDNYSTRAFDGYIFEGTGDCKIAVCSLHV